MNKELESSLLQTINYILSPREYLLGVEIHPVSFNGGASCHY